MVTEEYIGTGSRARGGGGKSYEVILGVKYGRMRQGRKKECD